MKDKKVLITGGAGLLGMALTDKLRRMGAKVTSTYHTREPMVRYSNVAYMHIDLTDEHQIDRMLPDCDYMFMCAAVIKGAGSMEGFAVDLQTPNTVMQALLLKWALEHKVGKVVFYGSSTSYPETDFPVTEDMMFDGDPYEKYFAVGWYKRYGEKLCELYNKLGLNVIVLRPSNIYGPHDKFEPERSHVTPALIRKVIERQNPLEVWGDGMDERDLIYVDDAVDASVLAVEKIDGYNPINIGYGSTVSVNEVLRTLLDIEGFAPEVKYIADAPTMIPKRYIDVSKAERFLGWKAKTTLREGLEKTLQWYRENY